MSDFTTVCDAIRDDLIGSIPELFDAKVHMYEPYDPEILDAPVGEWHIAIWPSGEEPAEAATPLAIGMHLFTQVYEVWIWQGAATENERLKRDEAAAARLYDVHNAIRERFYREENQELGGSLFVWYGGVQLAGNISRVRWFRIRLRVDRIEAFTQVP